MKLALGERRRREKSGERRGQMLIQYVQWEQREAHRSLHHGWSLQAYGCLNKTMLIRTTKQTNKLFVNKQKPLLLFAGKVGSKPHNP